MLILTPHSASDSLTMLSYDREAGMVVVKTTSPGTAYHPEEGRALAPEQSRITLAQFLRDIGIPFASVREITRATAEPVTI